MSERIPFNKPYVAGKELTYIAEAVVRGNISGDGWFTRKCSEMMEELYGVRRVLLTPSCTAALEMAVMLYGLGPGDEVILPSFTFVSTANAVMRNGATPVFVDVRPDTLNMDEGLIEAAITDRTRMVMPIHYAGVSAEMDQIMELAGRRGIAVVEDAAQGVHAKYKGRALGSMGHLGCYSFHSTKNYTCGEGGALCVNDEDLVSRAEIIREKGTDRSKFLRGEVDKYTWVDVGSSYVPSEIAAAFLYGQLERLDDIADLRRAIFNRYAAGLAELESAGTIRLPFVPEHCESNHHMFYVVLEDAATQQRLMKHLGERGISAPFHYLPLHTSPMGTRLGYVEGSLPVTENIGARLLRLPFFSEITPAEQDRVMDEIKAFFA